jgi:hypothetical protein
MMRALVLGAIVVGLVACGGSEADQNDPLTFPTVSGTYDVYATFDGKDSVVSNFSGVLVLTQASTTDGALTGSLRGFGLLSRDTSVTVVAPLSLAAVAEDGTIQFTADDGRKRMAFTGALSGTTLTGRYTLAWPGTTMAAGPWSATPASAARAERSVRRAP